MRPFMDENFLLPNQVAARLYHENAAPMPIYDYHCHLNPKEIAENKRFSDIGELFLAGDHYKWRAMSAYGIEERCIRGDASFQDKFYAYAKMMPYAIGNPLFHWTHLELKRVFGIDEVLSEKTAPDIWNRANALLKTDAYRARGLIERFGVKLICTTDDPVDTLLYHQQIARDSAFNTKVLPAFRPDKAIKAEAPGFAAYIETLADISNIEIHTVDDVLAALEKRIDYFHQNGARISDHGLDDYVPYVNASATRANAALDAARKGALPDGEDLIHYKTILLVALGGLYSRRGWTQQYHMAATRNNNTRAFRAMGPDTGFDSMTDTSIAWNLSRLLDAQDARGHLPKTILYALNPAFNHVLAAMAGNFQSGGVHGKVQFGSAWWFCDTKMGMEEQMKTLASVGLLSTFVGMLTDSRSFTSYPRHEYFRRILCAILGEWVENGEYPADYDTLGEIVRGISYENAVEYFGIDL